MRLIDIDAFRKEHRMAEHCEDCERNSRECQYNDFSMMDFCGWLDDAPIVDAAPVKHGKWVMMGGMKPPEYHHHHQCSVCESYAPMRPPMGFREELSPWCPACGAKMDLEGLDDHNGTD